MALNNLYQNQQPQGGIDQLAQNAMFPQSQMDKTQYAVPSQMPTSAEVINSDYDPQTDPYTGMPAKPFAAGGIATLRFDEGGSAPAPWDPSSGQVTLQQYDPTGQSDPKNINYTIPKDSIKQFIPNPNENGEPDPTAGGRYILNDGSTMSVGADGVVSTATPARSEYTLNKDGYYQPTGSGLTWNGGANLLTKNIGGVDVMVPGMYTKGGYGDAQGNLRTDANGVPVALAPNYLDSGFGQSGLADAAPFITAATMAAFGMPTEGMMFEGMVPASETLAGAATAGATTAPAVGGSMAPGADVFGGLAGTGGSYSGMTAAEQAAAATAASSMGPTYAELGYEGVGAKSTADAIAAADAGAKAAAAGKGMTAAQAMAAKAGLDMLTGGTKGSQATASGGGSYAAPQQITPDINRGGVTGYQGEAVSPNANITPAQLSGIKGVGQPQYFAQGGTTQGGIATLGSYSDGGQLLKGPGDGMSDNIPAKIGNSQPARLADGEFVIPADVVSHLGNGSTDAGAKQLYVMMEKIRKARTGNKKQGKRINPSKFLL